MELIGEWKLGLLLRKREPLARVCHYCLKPEQAGLPRSKLLACTFQTYGTYRQTYAENPYLYLDAMYKEHAEAKQPYFYPFLTYRCHQRTGRRMCGKYYCLKCLLRNNFFDARKRVLESCFFCTGHCYCARCELAFSVVRYQSEFLHYGGTLAQIKSMSMVYQIFPEASTAE